MRLHSLSLFLPLLYLLAYTYIMFPKTHFKFFYNFFSLPKTAEYSIYFTIPLNPIEYTVAHIATSIFNNLLTH